MVRLPDSLRERREASLGRLEEFRERVALLPYFAPETNLCVYITGSFARLDASAFSDLDLFFLHSGSREADQVPRIDRMLMGADLIEISRALGFPEFSDDAKYLNIHYLDNMTRVLGSPADDSENLFTARLLLLLESRVVAGTETYRHALNAVVESYYRDFHDHAKTFLPVFLTNDILRFWKTLCLNYEHKRNRPEHQEERRNRNHMRNLKLKFSRLLTCYSMLLVLSAQKAPVKPDLVHELVQMTPIDRLLRLGDEGRLSADGQRALSDALAGYAWFADQISRSREDALDWIAVRKNRDGAFERGRAFSEDIYELLTEVAEPDMLRYLVI